MTDGIDEPAGRDGVRVADYDRTIIEEAEKQRQHDLNVARVDAEARQAIERIRANERESRRTFIGAVLVGAAVVVVVLAIIAAIYFNVQGDRRAKAQRDAQHQEIAKACIAAGNIWINDACLLTRREPTR